MKPTLDKQPAMPTRSPDCETLVMTKGPALLCSCSLLPPTTVHCIAPRSSHEDTNDQVLAGASGSVTPPSVGSPMYVPTKENEAVELFRSAARSIGKVWPIGPDSELLLPWAHCTCPAWWTPRAVQRRSPCMRSTAVPRDRARAEP